MGILSHDNKISYSALFVVVVVVFVVVVVVIVVAVFVVVFDIVISLAFSEYNLQNASVYQILHVVLDLWRLLPKWDLRSVHRNRGVVWTSVRPGIDRLAAAADQCWTVCRRPLRFLFFHVCWLVRLSTS